MAFTVATSSSKIDITSGTGNLSDLETAVDDAGIFTSTGQVFEVIGNRELEISSGVTLNTTDGDTLQWNPTANLSPVLDVVAGAILNIAQNTIIDFDTNRTHQGRMYSYGTVNCSGTEGNEVIFQNMGHHYLYMYDTTPWQWDYVIWQNTIHVNNYLMYIFQTGISSANGPSTAHVFNNITVRGTGEATNFGNLLFYYTDMGKWTMDNWTVEAISNMYIRYGTTLKFTNSTFQNMSNLVRPEASVAGSPNMSHYDTSKNLIVFSGNVNQNMIVFENCTFDDVDSGVYGIYSINTPILLKNCTFDNQTYPIYANGATVLLYGTTTYPVAPTANIKYGGQGTVLHVRKLDITVLDENSDPLENAIVHIRQKDATREQWAFYTDSNGQIRCGGYDEDIYLVEREEYSNGNFVEWSDGTGDLVHVIDVSAGGYTVDSREVAMNQDREITVQLSVAPAGATTIYDSTFYGSTIY